MISALTSLISPSTAHGGPVLTARFKVAPEDFVVREWLGFEPDNAGDYMLVTVRKRGANTLWVAKQLAIFASADARDVGFAGLKDRHAITEQAFTVPSRMLNPETWLTCKGEGFEVIAAQRQRRKLKRGSHKGNHFEIVLRDLVGDRSTIEHRLQQIKSAGVPNYFGPQRFGIEGRNLQTACDWLIKGHDLRDRHQRGFALSAARSALFNAVLQARVAEHKWNQLLPGDLANLNGSGSVFSVQEVDSVLQQRCVDLDIHPTGPLWGVGQSRVMGWPAQIESDVISSFQAIADALVRVGVEAERRALRVWVRDMSWSFEESALQLKFTLHRGAFATAVIAELLGMTLADLGEMDD